MKTMKTTMILGISALSLLCGACGHVVPAPVADSNAAALGEPIPYYRNLQVFDEKNVPLCYALPANKSEISAMVVHTLAQNGAVLVDAAKPYDAKLEVGHFYRSQTITEPTPQKRYSLSVNMALITSQGVKLQDLWSTEVSDQKAYDAEAVAQQALLKRFNTVLKEKGAAKTFLKNTESKLAASVLRFATSRDLVEFSSSQFDADVRTVLNHLRKMDGVLEVRLIEADTANRILSCRVLYRKDVLPQGIAAEIRENKRAK